MTFEEIHSTLVGEFGDDITGSNADAIDPWIEVAPQAIDRVAAFLKTDERLQFDHLNDLTGVDYCEPDPKKAKRAKFDPHLEVVYHLWSVAEKKTLVLKVMLPRWKDDEPGELPELASVAGVWRTADWHEREAYDLCGVWFTDHPNLRRLLCPEDWVGHPLRKDYEMPLEYHGVRGK